MASPGPAADSGVRVPVPRTRTGCLTCRKSKVKCDEFHPVCSRCLRLKRECVWAEDLDIVKHRPQQPNSNCPGSSSNLALNLGQSFIIELPNVDRATVPYIHHFKTFCTRFLAYSNDNEGNPFQEQLFPLASSSPALLHAMAALAAGHLARAQGQSPPALAAAKHYSQALYELNATLSDSMVARSDATLGACLLLCVHEASNSESCRWLEHLKGARELMLLRGGPDPTHYLTRFFSFLDISGSLTSGSGPLLPGNYWLKNFTSEDSVPAGYNNWPFYDTRGLIVDYFSALMIFMSRLARLSAEAQSDIGKQQSEAITISAMQIHKELRAWWANCPPSLQHQNRNWRRQARPRKLTVSETLLEESFSSTRSVMLGCIIYAHHIMDPNCHTLNNQEVANAAGEILEIATECPVGFGLEMGLYWSLFMAGVAVFNDVAAENFIRSKVQADTTHGIYHADRGQELLDTLWKMQHETGYKHDWKDVQAQMGLPPIFILA